jgi:hypothetical protein
VASRISTRLHDKTIGASSDLDLQIVYIALGSLSISITVMQHAACPLGASPPPLCLLLSQCLFQDPQAARQSASHSSLITANNLLSIRTSPQKSMEGSRLSMEVDEMSQHRTCILLDQMHRVSCLSDGGCTGLSGWHIFSLPFCFLMFSRA